MKILVALILLISIAATADHQTFDEEPTEQVENISKFLLELISRYDDSGKGSIPIEKYPRFLADVLVKGHLSVTPGAEVSDDLQNLLMSATTGFVKKYNTTEVGVQDFYFDLVKQFTVYLLQHEQQYTPIIETFFGDTPYSDQPNRTNQGEINNIEQNEVDAAVEL